MRKRSSAVVPIVLVVILVAVVLMIWLEGDLLMHWLLALHGRH
jgi:hypothetical protein